MPKAAISPSGSSDGLGALCNPIIAVFEEKLGAASPENLYRNYT
jgi:hypothetical protein